MNKGLNLLWITLYMYTNTQSNIHVHVYMYIIHVSLVQIILLKCWDSYRFRRSVLCNNLHDVYLLLWRR